MSNGTTKTLGGDRLGSGKKEKIYLHGYERSNHDLGYMWRSTMAPGTLVPFMKQIALPGDSFKIELNADVKTLPTVGPLFGSFKLQLDVFQCPIRLYNAQLHMNKLGVGLRMKDIKFPTLKITAPNISDERTEKTQDSIGVPLEMQQINPSSLLSYMGIKNLPNIKGSKTSEETYNAIPILAYWDIYKNYYANKQEEFGYRIDNESYIIDRYVVLWQEEQRFTYTIGVDDIAFSNPETESLTLQAHGFENEDISEKLRFVMFDGNGMVTVKWDDLFATKNWNQILNRYSFYDYKTGKQGWELKDVTTTDDIAEQRISLKRFPLSNIDNVQLNILKNDIHNAFKLENENLEPYIYNKPNEPDILQVEMYGLGLKTYQSDIYNNWLKTEWLDGLDGINAVTAISTANDSFNIDTLILSRKVYDMMMRIAVSGASYEDWQDAVYGHDTYRKIETPIYLGGLSKEVIFQEVVSQAATEDEPLATLAGKGRMAEKHKGGYIDIRVDEPSYIMGIVSITPRIDYSQGNDWDMFSLKTMDDLHKPALDEIGFQDLLTVQMAGWDVNKATIAAETTYKSAGKTPAWINYMTNVNKTFGEFANPNTQMFMTLNRRYEARWEDKEIRIKDLTTYIDPQKYNYIFADTQRTAQNFWVQLGVDIEARRKMSAKVMPNL